MPALKSKGELKSQIVSLVKHSVTSGLRALKTQTNSRRHALNFSLRLSALPTFTVKKYVPENTVEVAYYLIAVVGLWIIPIYSLVITIV